MVKGAVSPRPLAPNLGEDSAPSFCHAAAVTTYAAAGVSAAGTSAPADFGGFAAIIARRTGIPPCFHDTDDRQCDLGHQRCLVRVVIADPDRVVRAGALLRVQLP
jgi:hypothetical protein